MYLFTPSQKRGFFVFAGLMVFFLCFFYYARQRELAKTAVPFPADSTLKIAKNSPASLQVSVNSADSATWEQLPGIGAVLSSRLVKYRKSLGGFQDLGQIKACYGLSPETFEKILPYLVLDEIPESLKITDKNHQQKNYVTTRLTPSSSTKIRLDLNQATAEELAQLSGIGTVLSQRIVNFRNAKKGFKTVEDIQKVYGLSPETYENIKNQLFISEISTSFPPNIVTNPTRVEPAVPPSTSSVKSKPTEVFDLNTATVEQLQTIPGIGEKTAQRIVEQRGKIGFFAKKEHVKSVWGISEENYARMIAFLSVAPNSLGSKRNLNKISYPELLPYPQMSKEAVSKLITTRKLNGFFKDWTQIQQIEGVSPEMMQALQQYFVIE